MKSYHKVLLFIILAILLLFIVGKIFNHNETYKRKLESDFDPNESTEKKSEWFCNTDVDKMTNKKTEICSIESKDTLDFNFPYSGGSIPKLVVQSRSRHKDVYIKIKGQFVSNYGHSLLIKFDNGNPIRYSFGESSTNETGVIFIYPAKSLYERIKKSKTMMVQAEFFQEGSKTFTFEVNYFKN